MPGFFNDFVGRLSPSRRDADFRRSFRNAVYSSADYLVLPLLWLVATPVFYSEWGAEMFGIWILVKAVIGFGGIVSLGLTDATIKFVSKYRALDDETGIMRVLRCSFTMYAILGVFAGIIVSTLAPVLVFRVFNIAEANRDLAIKAIRIGGLGIWVRFFHSTFQSGIYGFERYDLAAKVGIATNVLTTVISIVLVLLGYGVVEVLLVTISVLFFGGLVLALLLKLVLVPHLFFSPTIHAEILREMTGFGTYRWLDAIISSVAQNMDKFLIASFLSTSAMTYYAVSIQLTMHVHGLLSYASSFLFPFSGKLFEQKDYAGLQKLYDKASLLIIVMASGLLLPMYLLGHNILYLWMGEEFAQKGTLILQVLCIHFAFLQMGIVNFHYLRGAGLVRTQTIISSITAPTIILGMWLLIPHYGALGAAMGQLFVLPFVFFARLYVEKKIFNKVRVVTTLSYLLPVIVTFAIGTFFVFSWQSPVLSLTCLLLGLGLTAVAGCLSAFLTGSLCQKLGWIPA